MTEKSENTNRRKRMVFESIYETHDYNEEEKKILSSYDSIDYLPSDCDVYREWLSRQPKRVDWDRWIVMGLIGTIVGVIAAALSNFTDALVEKKWEFAEDLIQENRLFMSWLWATGISVLLVSASAISVVYINNSAASSGVPEVLAYLNGTFVQGNLTLLTCVVKFFSVVTAIGSGIPVGPEGPMVHIGAMIGLGLSQLKSTALKFSLPLLHRLRNPEDNLRLGSLSRFLLKIISRMRPRRPKFSQRKCAVMTLMIDLDWWHKAYTVAYSSMFAVDYSVIQINCTVPSTLRLAAVLALFLFKAAETAVCLSTSSARTSRRNFITAGCGAGFAAALRAPVGGSLFALEEISSFWSAQLGWMVFFCCMMAAITAGLFTSAFEACEYIRIFGIFTRPEHVLLKIGKRIEFHVAVFIPAIVIGVIGGLTGSLFIALNVKIVTWRHVLIRKLRRTYQQKVFMLLEPIVASIIWTTVAVYLPAALPCESMVCQSGSTTKIQNKKENSSIEYCVDDIVRQYWCPRPTVMNGSVVSGGEYNEVSSLTQVTVTRALQLLFSERTHYQFNYVSLVSVLVIYFFLACWLAGTYMATGIVMPKLFIGAVYGRIIGRCMVDVIGGIPSDERWQWIDPGFMAVLGSASFFTGVARLTMALAVVVMEITHNTAILLPAMVTTIVAKWVGDCLTHPFYHSLIEQKCLPYLCDRPIVYNYNNKLLNLMLFDARDVMSFPVITVNSIEKMSYLAQILLDTRHGGFPVLFTRSAQKGALCGLITRMELYIILTHATVRSAKNVDVIVPDVSFQELSADNVPNYDELVSAIQEYDKDPLFKRLRIDLVEWRMRYDGNLGQLSYERRPPRLIVGLATVSGMPPPLNLWKGLSLL